MARRGRNSLGERVYHALRRDLAAGLVDPAGRLGEERLAEAYGVSRTPVREALTRLLADGLVERHGDGLYPYRPRLDELGDLYELRIVLEARGIRRVRDEISASYDQEAVRRQLDTWRDLRADPPEPGTALIAADEQFHTALLAAAGNSALADALTAVHAKVRPIRSLDMPTPQRIAKMTGEHIAIAEQILAGDLESASHTLLTHILSSRAHVLARARQALELTRLGQALRD
ncbi:GntR family transcriptional regulator [Nocardia blacklockiae]|uniref:GntR family transcriptional regulator n=1 Tax=Nocardia blacklockiae TaxID=480036 RepID=UPI001893288E|nr:GntR family transcriptional regulator [Nocardia blacklockiae]MBF6172992.1 GntR family transcriptional regulator [Nocardia blacklockiae]